MVTLVIDVTKLPMVTIINSVFVVAKFAVDFITTISYQITNVNFCCRGGANVLDLPTFPVSYITVRADLSVLMYYLALRIARYAQLST